MPGANVQDLYGVEGSVPAQQAENGTGGREFSVRASPDAFGANIGNAVANLGEKTQEIATQYAQIYTEAKVNDDYANGYVPAAAKLRSQYDQLPIQDKIGAGYDNYINSLHELNKQFTNAQPGLIGQKMMGTQINRHIAGEIDSTSRERTQNLLMYSDQASAARAEAVQNDAVNNYADPAARATGYASAEGHAVLSAMNAGIDHSTEDGKALINDKVDQQQGILACRMANKAIDDGNLPAALEIKREAGVKIPNSQYSLLDQQTDNMALQQHAQQSAKAIVGGNPIPHAVGIPPAELRAMAVNDADKQGVDYNQSLATMFIESSNGTNLGADARRASIGQDKESAGKTPAEQISAMNKNIKEADGYAKSRFGADAQPWHTYAYYQQGKPVADALFEAVTKNPNANVVDVIQSAGTLDRKTAVAAVVGNHGDVNGTAGDFLNYLHNMYQRKEALSAIDIPKQSFASNASISADVALNTSPISANSAEIPEGRPIHAEQAIGGSPGDIITAPHTTTSPPVLPGANPMQDLKNWNDRVPVMLDRINAMPDPARREATRRIWEQHNEDIKRRAEAFSSNTQYGIYELASNKDFTDVSQLTPVQSMYIMDHPGAANYVEKMAEKNKALADGITTKDQVEKGPGLIKGLKGIGDGSINDPHQLWDMMYKGELTAAGVNWLTEKLSKDPVDKTDKKAEAMYQSELFKTVRGQLVHSFTGFEDVDGETKYQSALIAINKAIDKAKEDKIPIDQIYDPQSKNYVGNAAKPFIASPTQAVINSLVKTPEQEAVDAANPAVRTPERIRQEYWNTDDPKKRAALRKELVDMNVAREGAPATRTVPEAPISQ